ncbi:MAG: hypothetical protein NZ552_05965, partial [Planctomycetes bacterium]|nr:hypothetical protein [Planctomycetota bacterium]
MLARPSVALRLAGVAIAANICLHALDVPIDDPVQYAFNPDLGYDTVRPKQWIPDETDFFHKYTVIKPGGTSPMIKNPVTQAMYPITNTDSTALMVDCREKGWMGSISYMLEYPQPVNRIQITFDGKWDVYDANWVGWDGVHNDMYLYKDGVIVGEQYGYNITTAQWGGPNYGTKDASNNVVWQSFNKEFTGLSNLGAKIVRLRMLYFVTASGRGWLKNLKVEAWNAQNQKMTPLSHGSLAPPTDTTGWWQFAGSLLTDDPSRFQAVDGSLLLSAPANKRVIVQNGRLVFQ